MTTPIPIGTPVRIIHCCEHPCTYTGHEATVIAAHQITGSAAWYYQLDTWDDQYPHFAGNAIEVIA